MNYELYKRKKITLKRTILMVLALLICGIMLLITGVMFYCNNSLEYYPVKGESMFPLINSNGVDEDYVYANSNIEDITYGDIIIYNHNNVLVIKRVIAMANDNITIRQCSDGYFGIFIQYNSTGEWVKLEENYIEDKFVYQVLFDDLFKPYEGKEIIEGDGFKYIHVGENQIFYAGDNRQNSSDCIDYGPQDCENLIGEVVFLIKENKNRIFQVISQILGITRWL